MNQLDKESTKGGGRLNIEVLVANPITKLICYSKHDMCFLSCANAAIAIILPESSVKFRPIGPVSQVVAFLKTNEVWTSAPQLLGKSAGCEPRPTAVMLVCLFVECGQRAFGNPLSCHIRLNETLSFLFLLMVSRKIPRMYLSLLSSRT